MKQRSLYSVILHLNAQMDKRLPLIYLEKSNCESIRLFWGLCKLRICLHLWSLSFYRWPGASTESIFKWRFAKIWSNADWQYMILYNLKKNNECQNWSKSKLTCQEDRWYCFTHINPEIYNMLEGMKFAAVDLFSLILIIFPHCIFFFNICLRVWNAGLQ